MSVTDYPFEGTMRRTLRRIRNTFQNLGVMGYISQDEQATPVRGDEYGPYVRPMSRTANSDGTSPVVTDPDDPQLFLTDDHGRLYVNATSTPAGIQMVEGDLASGEADAADSNPVKIGGMALNEAPTLVTEGDRVNAFFDTAGRQIVDTDRLLSGEDPVHDLLLVHPRLTAQEQHCAAIYSTAGTASQVGQAVKASQGRVFQIRAIMTAPAAARYLMLFNKATAAVNTDIPVWRALLPATGGAPGEVQDNWEEIGGLFFPTGISAAMSTTAATLTLPAEDVFWHITYK